MKYFQYYNFFDMLLKKEVRDIVFKKRKICNSDFFNVLNDLFYKHFLSIDFCKNFNNKIIAGYCAFENECNTFEILKYYSKNNFIVLPAIVEKNNSIVFREWDCILKKLEKNRLFKKMEIMEPNCNCKKLEPNIVFVPAVAVDIYGNRVGYGAGYYDKTLKDLNCIKIVTVFDFQVFDEEIEHNENDVKMDYILTENKFISLI